MKYNQKLIEELNHVTQKSNWRITQLPNGYYQTEHRDIDNEGHWCDVTRRNSLEEAEAAVEKSIEHYKKKLRDLPIVVKTF